MLVIMIPDQCPNYYKALEIYTTCRYFNSLHIMTLFFFVIFLHRNYERLLYNTICVSYCHHAITQLPIYAAHV